MTRVAGTDTIGLLNRLFRLVHRSLPTYLVQAQPWLGPDGQKAQALLVHIATDHRNLAQRLAPAIRQQGGIVDFGEFPLEFTSMHDVAVDFILHKVHARLEHKVHLMARCVDDLAGVPSLQPIAEDMLRLTLEHLAAIRELQNAG